MFIDKNTFIFATEADSGYSLKDFYMFAAIYISYKLKRRESFLYDIGANTLIVEYIQCSIRFSKKKD